MYHYLGQLIQSCSYALAIPINLQIVGYQGLLMGRQLSNGIQKMIFYKLVLGAFMLLGTQSDENEEAQSYGRSANTITPHSRQRNRWWQELHRADRGRESSSCNRSSDPTRSAPRWRVSVLSPGS